MAGESSSFDLQMFGLVGQWKIIDTFVVIFQRAIQLVCRCIRSQEVGMFIELTTPQTNPTRLLTLDKRKQRR